jgi:hypothetical protein
MNVDPPETTDHMTPRMSLIEPWSTSPTKTVLLVPSVIEAIEMFPLWPNADLRY